MIFSQREPTSMLLPLILLVVGVVTDITAFSAVSVGSSNKVVRSRSAVTKAGSKLPLLTLHLSSTKEGNEEIGKEDDDVAQTFAATADATAPVSISTAELFEYVTSVGAITGRGEYATEKQKVSVQNTVNSIVAVSKSESSSIEGTWELVYSSTQLFRSSPFFMAGRAVCTTELQAARYNWFCDMHRGALAISSIQSVRQMISSNRLVSEFEVSVGAVPFLSDLTPFKYSGGLPLTITGSIVSTASYTKSSGSDDLELYMDTVQIKGSNIPLLRQILDFDAVELQSRELANALENVISSYSTPRPVFKTVHCNEKYRISTDEDDNVFVYVRTSSNTKPTDYTDDTADLGVAKLLEGFNNVITQIR